MLWLLMMFCPNLRVCCSPFDLVAPQVQNSAAHEEFAAVEIAIVDVLMEFQPEENMFFQQ
jgi:hypothetical protein